MTFIFKAEENKLDYPSIILLMFFISAWRQMLKKILGSGGTFIYFMYDVKNRECDDKLLIDM